jgi:uncharacterized protein YdbL (DUF1318 family)
MMGLVTLTACVTINVYFPAAAAERAADRIIEDVWGDEDPDAATGVPEQSGSRQPRPGEPPDSIAMRLLNHLVPPAQAAEPNLDVSSPAIRQIQARMQDRHRSLEPMYDAGAIGLTNDGSLAVRDLKALNLKDRKQANTLVAADNRDRAALYAEIARANGHTEWEAQIRSTFARRWIANARAGWWFQDGAGNWKQN